MLDEIEEKYQFDTQGIYEPHCILDCYVIGYYHDVMFGRMPIVAFIDKSNDEEGLMAPDHLTLRSIFACYKVGTYDRLPEKIKALIQNYESNSSHQTESI